MKIEKKLWITLVTFGLFAVIFSGWIYNKSNIHETLPFDNTTVLNTTSQTDNGVKTESIVLPDAFRSQKALLFKTTHTIAEVRLDGKVIYQYGNEKNAPKFMKSPGSGWHIVDIPANSAGKHLTLRIIPVYP